MYDRGIDYGLGQTNVDKETGIHFGVIHQNNCLQAWCDSAEPYYPPVCPHCGDEISQDLIDSAQSGEEDVKCSSCEHSLEESDFYDMEATSYVLNDGEYVAESDVHGDIFITKSPYYTICQYCSPCAPGAGYIMNTSENGIKAYCFGHDFFEEKAPYPIYNVVDNEPVLK